MTVKLCAITVSIMTTVISPIVGHNVNLEKPQFFSERVSCDTVVEVHGNFTKVCSRQEKRQLSRLSGLF